MFFPKSIMDYTEDFLIEKPTIALFSDELKWETANCFEEIFGVHGTLGRETSSEVILLSRLLPALKCLNPGLPSETLGLAGAELTRDHSLMSPAHANREIYMLLKEGVKVTFRSPEGIETFETVRVIDWQDPQNNDFFLASQFWVSGELHKRRPDLIGFVMAFRWYWWNSNLLINAWRMLTKTIFAIIRTPSRICSGTTP